MTKRFNELSVEDQALFESLSVQGVNAGKLARRFGMTYETARRNRQHFRDEARKALATTQGEAGLNDNDHGTSD